MNPDFDFRLSGLSYKGVPLTMKEKYEILYKVKELDGYTFEVLQTYLEMGMNKEYGDGSKLLIADNLEILLTFIDYMKNTEVEFLLVAKETTFDLIELTHTVPLNMLREYTDINVLTPPKYIVDLLNPDLFISAKITFDDNVDIFTYNELMSIYERSGLTFIEVLSKIAIEGTYGCYYRVTQHPITSYRLMLDDVDYPFNQDMNNLTRD